jgi:hypothetical protein
VFSASRAALRPPGTTESAVSLRSGGKLSHDVASLAGCRNSCRALREAGSAVPPFEYTMLLAPLSFTRVHSAVK